MFHIRKRTVITLVAAILFFVLTAESCGAAQVAVGGANQVTDLGFQIPKNAQGNTTEQQNVIDRYRVTTDPTKVMWIQLMTIEGIIVSRMSVAHKVTSSGKRLEPTAVTGSDAYLPQVPYTKTDGTTGYWYTNEMMGPDGTFGPSDNYIYWFDTLHRYNQLGTAGGMEYLLTDYPIDLTNPKNLVTGMYNMDNAAYQWQKDQQAQMTADATKTCQAQGKAFDSNTGGCK